MNRCHISSILSLLFAVFLLLVIVSASLIAGENENDQNDNPPRLSRIGISTLPKMFGSELLFKVTYTDADNNPPEKLYLVFDKKEYTMKEVDSSDKNVTDGKDYYVKEYFKKGNYIYYFFVSDGKYNVTTSPTTIIVADEIEWHFDIAVAISIVLVPVIFIIYFLKQLNANLKNLADQISTHLPLFVEENNKKDPDEHDSEDKQP